MYLVIDSEEKNKTKYLSVADSYFVAIELSNKKAVQIRNPRREAKIDGGGAQIPISRGAPTLREQVRLLR